MTQTACAQTVRSWKLVYQKTTRARGVMECSAAIVKKRNWLTGVLQASTYFEQA